MSGARVQRLEEIECEMRLNCAGEIWVSFAWIRGKSKEERVIGYQL